MPKCHINLSMERDVYELAKAFNINLSKEFEEWIKIRANSDIETKEENFDIQLAKHKEAILYIEKRKQIQNESVNRLNEENEVVNMIVKRLIENHIEQNLNWKDDIRMHGSGLQAIYKRRFNKLISINEAFEILENKLKEKGVNINE